MRGRLLLSLVYAFTIDPEVNKEIPNGRTKDYLVLYIMLCHVCDFCLLVREHLFVREWLEWNAEEDMNISL